MYSLEVQSDGAPCYEDEVVLRTRWSFHDGLEIQLCQL